MAKKRSKKNRLGKRSSKIILIILGLVLLLLLGAIIYENNIISNPLESLNKETRTIEVRDICSIIAGQLIHSISNEGECLSRCRAECESLNADYKGSDFQEIEDNCNECVCYCK